MQIKFTEPDAEATKKGGPADMAHACACMVVERLPSRPSASTRSQTRRHVQGVVYELIWGLCSSICVVLGELWLWQAWWILRVILGVCVAVAPRLYGFNTDVLQSIDLRHHNSHPAFPEVLDRRF